jgi:hypothetical protein
MLGRTSGQGVIVDRPSGIQLQGYRRVFHFERRLFHFHNWRIPYPHGIPLRGIGYFVALEFGVLCGARLPVLSALVGLLGSVVAYLAVPLGGAFVLLRVRIDGRPPHHVLASLLRLYARPRCLAGLEPCPDVDEEVVPLEDVTVAYDACEAFVVPGRIRGPARITFRYPSVGRVEGAPLWVRGSKARRARARRYRIRRQPSARPMLQGKVVTVPRGREVVIE